ncbi:c-type cytochrome [Thalassotalea castellviae]|uniref:C-type cytochrome n=1 Tax=Thalassotalea castellviae TaxID=3075612 RepID=A0ABU3A070_9GAMM|nr:c-type cytochrome [Thalassotalea sp. W431]MDT0603578.1 c-type cytochrome [Thalassotalea sp. W431]
MLKINVAFNYKFTGLIIAGLLFVYSAHTNANDAVQMYTQCATCHGNKGQGNELLKAPVLAGQSAEYIARQLNNFSSGIRGSHEKDTLGKQMLAFSQSLDKDKDVPVLSKYIESLPSISQPKDTVGDLKNGSRYYQAKCGACHSGNAQGNPSFKAPKLAGQSVDYLRRQMQNFVTGIRGTHAEDKLGRQMAMMAKTTSGQELEDILHFIAQQK